MRKILLNSIISLWIIICLFSPHRTVFAADVLILRDTDSQAYRDAIEGFRAGCECTAKEFDPAELDAVEKALKAGPSAIFVVGSKSLARVRADRGTPIVYALVAPANEPAESDFNFSGVSMNVSPDDYFGAMARIAPHAKRIGVIHDPSINQRYVRQAQQSAARHGLHLVVREAHSSTSAFKALGELRGAVDLFWLLPDQTVVTNEFADALMLFSFETLAPVVAFSQRYVDRGAAAALVANPREIGRQAAELARRILRGEKGPLRVAAKAGKLSVNERILQKLRLKPSPNEPGAAGGAR